MAAENSAALKKHAFWSSFLCFSGAKNLASPPHLLLKEYCAGFGLENLTPSAGVSDRPISAVAGAWRRLEFFFRAFQTKLRRSLIRGHEQR
jgi:hypothetical protein